MKTLIACVALAITAPAVAQRTSVMPGNFVDVTDIKITPGHFEEYMDFVKARRLPEWNWMKSKGYIKGWHIYQNTYPRAGEPDLFILTEYDNMPAPAEMQRREEEYVAYRKMDEHQMDADVGTRAGIRTVGSQTQLQEILIK